MGVLREVVAALHSTALQNIAPVLPFEIDSTPHVVFDLCKENRILNRYEFSDPESFSEYIFGEMEDLRDDGAASGDRV